MPGRRLVISKIATFVTVLAMTVAVLASRLGVLLGLMIPAAMAQETAPASAPAVPVTVLTNVEQIVALGTNVPANQYQARLQGAIIYISTVARRLYVQSGERGVQLNLAGSLAPYKLGQRIDVEGMVVGGLPELRLGKCRVEVLGEEPLPPAKSVSPHRLAVGAEPYRYLTIRGVVRDMVSDRNYLRLQVAHEGLVFEAFIPGNNQPIPAEWLDAELELRGLSWPVRNSNARASGFHFHVANTNFLTVLTPGVRGRFDRPLLTCAEAARVPQEWRSRVRISGTVTVHRPGVGFYVDDGTGVIYVELLQPLPVSAGNLSMEHEPQTGLRPGDRVEVIGLRRNWYSLAPTLIQAEYRMLGPGQPVAPRPVSVDDLLEGRYAGELVTLDARLLDKRGFTNLRMSTLSLVFRAGDTLFQARWESEDPAQWDLKLDGYVRITGVNDAEGSASRRRSTFQILLRTPQDVQPAREPPFWTRPEARRIGLASGGVALVAAAWILLQRWQMRRLERRVGERTTDLSNVNARLREEVAGRERAEADLRRALEAEKELNQLKSSFVSMVSHEFRTPLEVILSSSNILDRYLDRLPPDKRKAQLRAIRSSVHRMSDLMEDVLLLGRFEAGRLDCHPVPLDLELFCRQLCADVEAGTAEGRIHCTVGPFPEKASADAALLQHILSNLLSNALKYSDADTWVDFSVMRRDGEAVFAIRDSGCGIPAADHARLFGAFYRGSNVGQTPGTGLGLVIVKRCVERHGGRLQFESAEGKGTTFTVHLPLFPSRPATVSESSIFPKSNSREDDSHH